jgi:xanthine dehydrogenase accessory factor
MNAPAMPRSRTAIPSSLSAQPSVVGRLHPAAAEAAPPLPAVEWLKPLRNWPQALLGMLEQEPAVVRTLVTQVLGSAPREAGVCMLVGRDQFQGTIGGGQLEWQAMAAARALQSAGEPAARIQRIVLAADVAQCCGGVVELWMQRYTRADRAVLRSMGDAARRGSAVLISTSTASGAIHESGANHQGVHHQIVTAAGSHPEADVMLRTPRHQALPRVSVSAAGERVTLMERLDDALPALWLYGAGHVGQALARIVAELPLELTWIDPRAQLFPATIPDSVRVVHALDPQSTVATAAAGTRFVVLTHSHALDYALCRAILLRGDFASLGLIGSVSKGARFRSRLARDGVSAERIARLQCPISAGAITSKWPAAIAVAVASDLLREISGEAVLAPAPSPALAPAPTEACAAVDCAGCRVADGNVAHGKAVDGNAIDGK